MAEQQYAGFWIRTVAHIIDFILSMLILSPILNLVFGTNNIDPNAILSGDASIPLTFWLIQTILPAIAIVVFWYYKSATPGKMVVKVKIVDIVTGKKPTVVNLIIRYIAYAVSIIPLCLGLIWVGFDQRKQGWHDKLAGTTVVKTGKAVDVG